MHRTCNVTQNWEVENAWVSRCCWLIIDLFEGTSDFAVCSGSRDIGYQTQKHHWLYFTTNRTDDAYSYSYASSMQILAKPLPPAGDQWMCHSPPRRPCGTVFDLRCCSPGRTWRVSCRQRMTHVDDSEVADYSSRTWHSVCLKWVMANLLYINGIEARIASRTSTSAKDDAQRQSLRHHSPRHQTIRFVRWLFR